MKKYKYRRTTENLVFVIDLSYKGKSLGEATSENLNETISKINSVRMVCEDRSDEVRSFDINKPFVVGLNGVTSLKGDKVTYVIDGNQYSTSISTGDTEVVFEVINDEYTNRNYFYDENKLGIEGILKNLSQVNIERGKISVVDRFTKLKNVKGTDGFEIIGNGFYKIIDQTIK